MNIVTKEYKFELLDYQSVKLPMHILYICPMLSSKENLSEMTGQKKPL